MNRYSLHLCSHFVSLFFLPTFIHLAAATLAAEESASRESSSTGRRPNVVFILADDLGWGDLGCYGNPDLDTPVIDSLAKSGVRLTAHYSPSPLCAPARAGYLTGRFNHRTGAVDVPSNRGLDRLASAEKTLGDYFRHAGYSTALIGKWHNGVYCRDHLPHRRGFDLFFGFPNGGQDYWKWNLLRNDRHVSHDGRYLSDALNDEAITFIQRADEKRQPFALFLAHHTPHVPLQAPRVAVEKYRKRLGPKTDAAVAVTYAMIETMDTGLGRVFKTLRNLGLWENTIIVFTSDNGPSFGRDGANPDLGRQSRFNGGLAGEKQWSLEGGIRVPALVSWPDSIRGNRVIDVPIHGCDWLPTLFEQTGSEPPPDALPLDGKDVMSVLRGNEVASLARRALQFQRNRYAPVAHSNAAIRSGRWKLYWPGNPKTLTKDSGRDNPSYLRGVVRPHWEMPLDRQLAPASQLPQPRPRLFDLSTDSGEQHDVASDHPEIVERLTRRHDAWFSQVQKDWRTSRASIIAEDRRYWESKPAPDPALLYQDFWQWKRAPKGIDASTADPLEVFEGFWTAGND